MLIAVPTDNNLDDTLPFYPLFFCTTRFFLYLNYGYFKLKIPLKTTKSCLIKEAPTGTKIVFGGITSFLFVARNNIILAQLFLIFR